MKIKYYRLLTHLSQRILAKILGVSFVTVSNWENGRTGPHRTSLVKMAELFGCRTEDLI